VICAHISLVNANACFSETNVHQDLAVQIVRLFLINMH